MSEIRVLVLGNEEFAHKLDKDLEDEGIDHLVDQEDVPGVAYDLYICNPDMSLINSIDANCGSRILVFNGVHISNATLKHLVKLRISGFLDDHSDTSLALSMLKSLHKAKQTCARLSSKIQALCA